MEAAVESLISVEIERRREEFRNLRARYRDTPDPSRRDWISSIVECLGRAERLSDGGADRDYAMCMIEAAAIAAMAAEDEYFESH